MITEDNRKLLHEKTEARLHGIAAQSRGVLGFAVVDLVSGETFGLNESHVFPQASAIKIPVLMEVHRQARQGKFKLSDIRRIEKHDKTAGSGVLAELGDGSVQMSIYDLCVLMIVLSDNTATNMLIHLTGMDAVNEMLATLGLQNTRLRRRMMDTAASLKGDENVSTPAESARIMEMLFRGKFLDPAVCDEILAILKKPKLTNIISGLPAGVTVASKPGGISGVCTEWAVVLLKNRPYVVTIMEAYGVAPDAPTAIKEISGVLYEYFDRLDRATPFGVYFPIVVPPTP